MKRTNCFSQNCDCLPICQNIDSYYVPYDCVTEDNQVFDMIYARDSLTGAHKDALGVFLGKDTSPLVRQFIQDNLYASQDSVKNPVYDGVSDDDMAALTRQRYETDEEYISKVRKFMDSSKEEVQKLKRQEMKKKRSNTE